MKRLLRLFLTVVLIISTLVPIKATNESEILEYAINYLNSALAHKELFDLPDLSNENIYISNPIKHCSVNSHGEYSLMENYEIYLIYTDDEFIGGMVVAYENNQIIATSFNIFLAELFNENQLAEHDFILIGKDGKYSVEIIKEDEINELNREFVYNVACYSDLYLTTSYNIQPRSGRVLNISYVAQVGNTCWAASALALAWYYYPNTNTEYTPTSVATMYNLTTDDYGTMNHTWVFLDQEFNINCTRTTTVMDKGTIINHINNSRPIIVGYLPTGSGAGHMVVLSGYDVNTSNSSVNYYFRDSNYSTFQIVTSSSSPNALIYAGSPTLYWAEAIYKP